MWAVRSARHGAWRGMAQALGGSSSLLRPAAAGRGICLGFRSNPKTATAHAGSKLLLDPWPATAAGQQ